MEPGGLGTFAEVLQATGPYGLVCVLGWAFWKVNEKKDCLLYTSPSPRDRTRSRMPSSA